MVTAMTETEKKIGYKFKDKMLLNTALTHSSYANEKRIKSNERLEFLGDSVLSIIISDYIFHRMKNVDEGDLSKFRATLVCEGSLAEVSKKIKLSELVMLGKGEEITGGRNRPSVISDAFEAILGAIYLDSDIDTAREWLLELMSDRVELVLSGGLYSDYKTTLQELVQKDGKSAVTYSTIKTVGADHNRQFTVQVEINGEPMETASGRSKKEAEQNAARILLDKLKNEKV